jgi:hypothetical protein
VDGTAIAIVVGLAEVVVLVILWIRVRAAESLVAEEMSLQVDATRRAIDTLQERLSPLGQTDSAPQERREKRRSRRGRRKRS